MMACSKKQDIKELKNFFSFLQTQGHQYLFQTLNLWRPKVLLKDKAYQSHTETLVLAS
jgi:hypothetical protein